MATSKIAITIEKDLLVALERLVSAGTFPNRSNAIQEAVREKLDRIHRGRLARECSRLDPLEEIAVAEEGLSLDEQEWPTY